MSLLRRLTIRARMLGAIGMVLFLLALLGGAGLHGLRQVDAIGLDFANGVHADAVRLGELRTHLGNLRRFEKDVLINAGSSAEQTGYIGKWRKAVSQTQAAAEVLARSGQAEQAEMARRIGTLAGQYADSAAPVLQAQVAGGQDVASGNRALAPAKKAAAQAEAEVERLQAMLATRTEASSTARQAASDRAVTLFIVTLCLAVVLVVPLTLLNMVSICRPIDQARQEAERIATGNLGQDLVHTGADETAGMLKALDRMQAALRGLVGQVRQSADSIQVASSEVASGNADLSQRTEETASNLQQTASSLQQLTANVRQSADAAAQANQLAASAQAVAQRGGDVVGQVVSTMDEINTSSKRIADIIGTIDGIAFQTNILALNAAVEAARAGEQGRGFAVVASEVRSLAQRSAEAAREIKSLIGTSVEKVETGARLVQDAGSTMGEIVASVQRVSDVIGEITAASAEQSQGIAQVNGAVANLDQMTQQNAALVEESAAAAESLKEQAQRLTASMQVFRLTHGSAALASSGAPVAPAAFTAAVRQAEPALAVAAVADAAPKAAPAPRPAPQAIAPAARPAKADAPAPARPAEAAQAAISQARETSRPAAPPSNDDWESF